MEGFNLTLIGTFVGDDISNYSLADQTRVERNYTTVYPNNVTATVLEQSATLPNGVEVTLRFEMFESDTWKDFHGYIMPLSKDLIKISVIFSNIINNAVGNLWWQAYFSWAMMMEEDNIIPITLDAHVKLDPVQNGTSPLPWPPTYNQISLFEKRFRLITDFIQNATYCLASGECYCGPLKNLWVGPDSNIYKSIEVFLNMLQEQLDKPVKFFETRVFLEVSSYNIYNTIEWDPQVSMIFNLQPPLEGANSPLGGGEQQNNDTVVIAAGVTVGVIVLLTILIVVLVVKVRCLRAKFIPAQSMPSSKVATISMATTPLDGSQSPSQTENTSKQQTTKWRRSTPTTREVTITHTN